MRRRRPAPDQLEAWLGLVSGATGHAFDLAALLADFHDAHPSAEVALTEDATERMQAALLAGELDIAVPRLLDHRDEVTKLRKFHN
ncbi:LysR substrate-binding domain-containing protein [Streptomyces sp. NPDC046931]|uniref:LysR substrate-binding domain-containing protein n=1 Tax=Streptomyces sp. NPDC046931 TaxID=3154806 RepID=UPI0033F55702